MLLDATCFDDANCKVWKIDDESLLKFSKAELEEVNGLLNCQIRAIVTIQQGENKVGCIAMSCEGGLGQC